MPGNDNKWSFSTKTPVICPLIFNERILLFFSHMFFLTNYVFLFFVEIIFMKKLKVLVLDIANNICS
jgi:hypothetical protein